MQPSKYLLSPWEIQFTKSLILIEHFANVKFFVQIVLIAVFKLSGQM